MADQNTQPSWFLAQNNRGGFDGDNIFEGEFNTPDEKQSSSISLQQMINGGLNALSSGGVNFLRNPSVTNAVLPLISGAIGLSKDTDPLKDPTNYGNVASIGMSALGKGSPLQQALMPQVIEGAVDVAQNPTAGTLGKQLGLSAYAAASPSLFKKAATRMNRSGVLETIDTMEKLNKSSDDILKPRDLGSERIKADLQPQTETIQRGFDTSIAKANRQVEAQARALESKAKELEQLVVDKKLTGGAAQFKQRQINQLRNEAAKLRLNVQDPTQGTSTFTIVKKSPVPAPGSVEEDLLKVKDTKDPAFSVADKYQTQYFQALDQKNYAVANQISEKMLDMQKKYPNSLAARRAFTKNIMTEAAAQIPKAPLDRGRQLNPASMRAAIERASKLTPEAKVAIFGSAKEGDEYIRFLATVPDAIERGITRYKIHLGGTAGSTGLRTGLGSFTSLFDADALANAFANRSFDKTGNASKAVNLIKALASDDTEVVKMLSQPGVFSRVLSNAVQAMQDSKTAVEKEQKAKPTAAPTKPVNSGKV